MLYVDPSAFSKRYLPEPGRDLVFELMENDLEWTCARHGLVEIHGTIARAIRTDDAEHQHHRFDADWMLTTVVEVDRALCALATEFAKTTNLRALDAMHLAAAWRVNGPDTAMLTFDKRLAAAAEQLGIPVAA